MSLYAKFKGTGPSGYGYGTPAEEIASGLDLSGKHILLTGCNSGIGNATLDVLAQRGATVYGAARSEEKAQTACAQADGDGRPVVCELSDLESVVACAEDVRSRGEELDAIICNAGIMALPELEQVHGYEKQFFVNHIGHFCLVTNLVDQLADDGRVVILSSAAHTSAPNAGIDFDNLDGEKHYSPFTAYGQSKLANLLTARELARRFEEDDSDRVANAVHPGVIATNLGRHMNVVARAVLDVAGPLFLKSEQQGAATQTWAAVHPDAEDINGEYLQDCNVSESSADGRDLLLARKLWQKSEEIVEDVLGEGS